MTHVDDTFERTVHAWLHADAEHRVPDHLVAVLRRTSAERQRPAWSIPERWLPVDTTFRPRFFRSPPIALLVLIGVVVIALVALLVFAVGSREQRLPAPFGPARNGLVLSSGNGDIVSIDLVTLERRTLVGGSTFDFGPTFSRDGTRFMFLRGAPPDCGEPDCGLYLMVANADGSALRQLTPGLPALDWSDWSPDGTRIAILIAAPSGQGHVLQVVKVDGRGMTSVSVGRPAFEASWLPPTGTEIVFRGEQTGASGPGIFAIRPDGSGLRELSTRPAHSRNDYEDVAVSPDGSRVAYRDDGDAGGFQLHILDLRTRIDRVIPGPKGQFSGIFSPDGESIAFIRGVAPDRYQLVVAPTDGSSAGRTLGPPVTGSDGPSINNCIWSPDGTAILCNYDTEKVARLLPIDGSTPVDLDHGDLALPAYQRLAP